MYEPQPTLLIEPPPPIGGVAHLVEGRLLGCESDPNKGNRYPHSFQCRVTWSQGVEDTEVEVKAVEWIPFLCPLLFRIQNKYLVEASQ